MAKVIFWNLFVALDRYLWPTGVQKVTWCPIKMTWDALKVASALKLSPISSLIINNLVTWRGDPPGPLYNASYMLYMVTKSCSALVWILSDLTTFCALYMYICWVWAHCVDNWIKIVTMDLRWMMFENLILWCRKFLRSNFISNIHDIYIAIKSS